MWSVIVVTLAVICVYWIVADYNHWMSHPTLIGVKDIGYPISKLKFPSVTVCGQGLVPLEPVFIVSINHGDLKI